MKARARYTASQLGEGDLDAQYFDDNRVFAVPAHRYVEALLGGLVVALVTMSHELFFCMGIFIAGFSRTVLSGPDSWCITSSERTTSEIATWSTPFFSHPSICIWDQPVLTASRALASPSFHRPNGSQEDQPLLQTQAQTSPSRTDDPNLPLDFGLCQAKHRPSHNNNPKFIPLHFRRHLLTKTAALRSRQS